MDGIFGCASFEVNLDQTEEAREGGGGVHIPE